MMIIGCDYHPSCEQASVDFVVGGRTISEASSYSVILLFQPDQNCKRLIGIRFFEIQKCRKLALGSSHLSQMQLRPWPLGINLP